MITIATGTAGTRSTYRYQRPERVGEGYPIFDIKRLSPYYIDTLFRTA